MRIQAAVVLVLVLGFVHSTLAQNPKPDPGTPSEPRFDSRFDQHWSDNKAEIAGYDFVTPRYGELRKGVAVTIFVTETFSNSARVKADPGKHPPHDEFPVMKLNVIEDFPTGVYDYNLMASVFVALRAMNNLPAGTPTKISFSAQEWCGHAYQQALVDESVIRSNRHSYFDGEADASDTIKNMPGALYEDAMLLWARGLAGPFLSPGESKEVPMLRSLKRVRLAHKPLEWETAKIFRREAPERITVPAGTFDVEVRTVEVSGGRTWTIYVEHDFPHRVVKWTCSDGEQAELLGAERLTYWQMNRAGLEDAVRKFGLSPRPPRTP